MNYNLKHIKHERTGYLRRLVQSIRELGKYINKSRLSFALVLVVLSSGAAILTPYLLGQAIDKYISKGDIKGLTTLIIFLLVLYLITNALTYFQQNIIGKVGQDALYKLRGAIFEKIQSLPIAFFNQNKAGDLMSRINNDTEKLSEFLSESIVRFAGGVVTLLGVGIFILYLNFRLGLVLLASTVVLFILTRIFSPLLESTSREASAALGDFTSGVSEQLTNFKAIIAFDRRNFFERSLEQLNANTYKRSLAASFLNKLFDPIYDGAGNVAQVSVLVYGIYLIAHGNITIGLLIGFLNYTQRFYDPLRYFAQLFGDVQSSLASWGRVRDILSLSSNMVIRDDEKTKSDHKIKNEVIMEWKDVSFDYDDASEETTKTNMVLKDVSLQFEKGKTYALVGPTGGGKSTMASLMMRLYDPTGGAIYWKDRDLRAYDRNELADKISVILQEPYLFSGTVADNIRYGNEKITGISNEELEKMFEERGLDKLIHRFPEGIMTHVETGGENISIGQKQLISFVRTVLREPELLILDEATANIDTVTEDILENLIGRLSKETTKVIIAHRLSTIREADDILFIGGGNVKEVSDSKEVLELLGSAAKN